MMTDFHLEQILGFLDDLSKNNNKAWFDTHRPEFDIARGNFERFIEFLIEQFRIEDHLQDLSAKDCIARIYRDIRFSKDKSPYKTRMTAVIAPGGWKSNALGYYISLESHGQSMVAGGLHEPTSEQLNQFRQAINENAVPFKKLIHTKDFIENFGAVPSGMTQISSPNNSVLVIGRVLVESDSDLPTAYDLSTKITLMPLK